MLTHTAGIPNFTALPEYNTLKNSDVTPDKIIATFKDKPLDFGPGEKMSYSNSGYVVLGASSKRCPAEATGSSSRTTSSRRSA